MNRLGKKIIIAIIIQCIIIFSIYYLLYQQSESFDIVIIGGGLAGLTSALESYRLSKGNMRILLIEKEPKIGGNSQKATSGINLLQTPITALNNITDNSSLFVNDTMQSGKNLSDIDLVSTMVNDSKEIYSFFNNLNIDLSQVSILGGHSVPRTHRPSNTPTGISLTSSLHKLLLHQSNVVIRTNATFTSLLFDQKSNKINGLSYIETTNRNKQRVKIIESNAVILSTGGFAHDFYSDDSLIKEFVPHLLNYPTTNGDFAQGQGVKLARKIGADIIGMDRIQIHPTGFVNIKDRFNKSKILAPELLRGVGGILINNAGKRFCNELGYRDYVTKEILINGNSDGNQSDTITDTDTETGLSTGTLTQIEAYIILNEEGRRNYGKNIEFYINNGYLRHYTSFKLFAIEYFISEIELKKTIVEYNAYAAVGLDPFNKTTFSTTFDYNEAIYVGIVTPSIHYTMGGLKITQNAEVVNKNNKTIKGLYAAGEVTGGVHGGNRLGGNSLLECAVYGRRGARSAFNYIYNNKFLS